jgi:hypothetical protein
MDLACATVRVAETTIHEVPMEGSPMKRFIAIVSLGLSLVAGSAAAQDPTGSVINADGNSGASNSGTNPAVDADGPTIVYGDLNPGAGNTVIGPPAATDGSMSVPGATGTITATDGDASALGPGNASASPGTVTRDGTSGTALLGPDGTYSVTEEPPSNVSVGDSGVPAPVPEPIYEPVAEPVESVPVETAVGVEGDLDGDNYADALELEVGLDPNNPDTDGDGVADGDEVNIYGTDPYYWDTDGDGLGDGVELYDTRTDPLVFEGDGSVAADGAGEAAVSAEPLVAEETAASASADDADGDRLADVDEAAIGTDPNTPDSDGDGYYDGDEAALGTDPHDPVSFPAV